MPIIFTAIEFDPVQQADGGLWVKKIPTLRQLTRSSHCVEIDPGMQRQDHDLLIIKQ